MRYNAKYTENMQRDIEFGPLLGCEVSGDRGRAQASSSKPSNDVMVHRLQYFVVRR